MYFSHTLQLSFEDSSLKDEAGTCAFWNSPGTTWRWSSLAFSSYLPTALCTTGPDRPFLLLWQQNGDLCTRMVERTHLRVSGGKRLGLLEKGSGRGWCPGCLLTRMAAQEPLPTCRTPLAHRPMFSEGTITLLMFCRSSAPLDCPTRILKTKGRFENHHEEPGLWESSHHIAITQEAERSEFYFWMKVTLRWKYSWHF